jgi:hypothetical protein
MGFEASECETGACLLKERERENEIYCRDDCAGLEVKTGIFS